MNTTSASVADEIADTASTHRHYLRPDTVMVFTLCFGREDSLSLAQLLLHRDPAHPRFVNVMWRLINGLTPACVGLSGDTAWQTSPYHLLLADGLAHALARITNTFRPHSSRSAPLEANFLESALPVLLTAEDCCYFKPDDQEVRHFTCRLSPLVATVAA